MGGEEARRAQLWSVVDAMLRHAPLSGVIAHRLAPLAGHLLRERGEPLPAALAAEERAASLSLLTATPLVERLREHATEPLVLIKGPEVAQLYPGRARRFSDIDVLAGDADGLQRALLAAGFVEVHDPEFDVTPDHHHLQPLKWPTIWLKVEVHAAPNWPRGVAPPNVAEILEARVPSASGIDGVFAPTPSHHALLLAAHAWRHEPLEILRDLIDVASVAEDADERELDRTAATWGLRRVWSTTRRAIDALFYSGPETLPLRWWARHLVLVRERTVLERHVGRLVNGYWALPPQRAFVETMRALPYLVKPQPDETWSEKAARTGRALRNPGRLIDRRGDR